MPTILEDICKKIGEKKPDEAKEVITLVKKLSKHTPQDVWNSFLPETREYLLDARKAIKTKSKVPMPPDLVESKEKSKDEEADFYCETQQKLYSVENILNMLEKGILRAPEFQRKFIWKKTIKGSFIDSVFKGIPISSLIFAIDPKKKTEYFILDGFQRISTINQFRDGGMLFKGSKFDDLAKDKKNTFLLLNCPVIEVRAEKRFWREIFTRLNKGGVSLNDVEVRRALYNHPLIDSLEQLTETHEVWITLFGNDTRYKGLSALLRVMALHHSFKTYNKPFSTYLDTFCSELPGLYDTFQVSDLVTKIDRILLALHLSLGKLAFRMAEGNQPNLGLIDSMIHSGLLALAENPRLDEDELGAFFKKLRSKMMKDPAMVLGLTKDPAGKNNVIDRMAKVEDMTLSFFK